jgi:hypothetical protein
MFILRRRSGENFSIDAPAEISVRLDRSRIVLAINTHGRVNWDSTCQLVPFLARTNETERVIFGTDLLSAAETAIRELSIDGDFVLESWHTFRAKDGKLFMGE